MIDKISFRDKWVKKMIRWDTAGIIFAATTFATFLANPEAAFGVIRKLNTKNKLSLDDVNTFLTRHPVWAQCERSIGHKKNQNAFFALVANSSWGQKNDVHATFQLSGRPTITWESKKGTKTKEIDLSMEMVGYGTDSRAFISLDIGGSMIRSKLIKDGTGVNMIANDDHNATRYVIYGDRLEESQARREKNRPAASGPTSQLMSALLSGKTITFEAGLWS
jgi:hypothetical protein